MNTASDLGRRIVIWGATGSGKTTLSRRLGAALSLPVVELDAIKHARGWDSVGWDEFRQRLTGLLDSYSEGWVCEGSYRPISDVYLSRADTLIWLNLPWRVSFTRLFKRTVSRAIDQKPLYEGSPAHESWRQSFASRNSILLWSWKVRNRARVRVDDLPPHIRLIELRSGSEVEVFMSKAIEQQSVSSS